VFMTIRRKYSAEFKREAVLQTQHPGVSCNQVALELGINPNVLGRWKRELEASPGRAFAGSGVPRDEELARLKRELARVKKERDFLREAATFFARESS
jgi:transposase